MRSGSRPSMLDSSAKTWSWAWAGRFVERFAATIERAAIVLATERLWSLQRPLSHRRLPVPSTTFAASATSWEIGRAHV